MNVTDRLQGKIVPVVAIRDRATLPRLAAYMTEHGIDVIEITFRTAFASEAIRFFAQHYPQICVGAGTVLDEEQLAQALDAGAQFIVSPGLDERVVAQCLAKQVCVLPGVETASEVLRARRMGLRLVKFFPAEACGGAAKLKALAAPFADMKFMPTGGITAANVQTYLDLLCVHCVGGTYVLPKEIV